MARVCPIPRTGRNRATNRHPEKDPFMPRLVLASGSPFRRELLGRLGIDFIAEDDRCDEESVMT